VYDGDTVWLAARVHAKVYKYKVRMYGYDSPEMKPLLSKPDRNVEMALAKDARKYLEDLLTGKKVEAEFFEYCKYGRPLVNLYTLTRGLPPVCVNQAMIDARHGKVYFGKKKPTWGSPEQL